MTYKLNEKHLIKCMFWNAYIRRACEAGKIKVVKTEASYHLDYI